MRPNRAFELIVAFVVLAAGQQIGGNRNGYLLAQDQPPPIPGQEQTEVLTRGPVHEAFAEPVPLQVQAALIVPNQPPANIAEVPPADRPQGDHFVWVPGYWAWDADRNDFIWVSACWRVGPPNMSWVPGYWAQVTDVQEVPRRGVEVGVGAVQVRVGGGVDVQVGGGVGVHVGGEHAVPVRSAGWEWVSGFWAPTGAQEIEYLPAPPAPIDLEPPGPPPAADNMWVPGCWYWHEGQYVRRTGYWLQQRPDWVWQPSHYRWTPRGYVFEAGHWDYSLERRGVLFAPVYFPRSVYAREGFSYSPSIAIDVGVLSANLFTYPRYGHYYFGDYYDDAYLSIGIYPEFECESRHTWYDPIYTYDRWHYGQADKQWQAHQRQEYDQRRANKDLRPARTYREMETRVAKMPAAQRTNYELAKPIQTIAARKASPMKFEQISAAERQKVTKQAADAHSFRDERVKWEATGQTNPKAVRPPAEIAKTPPAEPKGPAAPAAERREPVAPAVAHKEPVPPAVEHKEPVTPAVAHKEPVPLAEPKGPVTPAAGHTPDLVPPRQVQLTQPERVKMPVSAPIVGKPAATPGTGEKGPPPQPADELKHKNAPKAEVKDTPKAEPKETRKDEEERKTK